MFEKILIYYEQKGYGGVDTHLAQLLNNWPDCDDQFIVISNHDNEGLSFFENQLINPAVKVIKIEGVFDGLINKKNKLLQIFYFVLFQIKFVIYFSKLLKKLSPDVLISNNGGFPGGLTCWLASLIGRSRGKTKNDTFLLVHHAPPEKKGGFYFYVCFLAWLNQHLNIPAITVSKASKRELELQTPLKNIHVIYNGLESRSEIKSYGLRTNWGIAENKIIIGMIGPIDAHKGHPTILNVFHLSKILKKTAHFVIVGSGDEVLVSDLKSKVRVYELEDVVTFTGFLSEDSNTLIRVFDILAMPTTDFEGFGYSMAEAMLAGIPVVASQVGAIPEIIENGLSGFLISPADIRGWRLRLEHMVCNEDERIKIGLGGQRRITKQFSAKKMSQSYYDYISN